MNTPAITFTHGHEPQRPAHRMYPATKGSICELTGMSIDMLNNLILDSGIAYLHDQCRGHQPSIDVLRYESFYWAWWRNLWRISDCQMIAQMNEHKRERISYENYVHFHHMDITSHHTSTAYMHLISPIVRSL